MPEGESKFFRYLPAGKVKGFCEPREGDLHNSTVVDINTDCKNCQWHGCHMFSSKSEGGEIVGRSFTNHYLNTKIISHISNVDQQKIK